MFVAILILAAVGFVAGTTLLLAGLRGRRVDDHPLCRKCGRDLFGLHDPHKCPECGAYLRRERPRIGNRARRGRLMTAGAFLLVPCLLWLGGVAALTLGGADATALKPLWLLRFESRGAGFFAARAATELERRAKAGDLSDAWMKEQAGLFLDDQADRSKPWVADKGDFIEQACVLKVTGIDEWQRYVEQGVGPMVTRPRVRAGGQLIFGSDDDARVGGVRRFGSLAGAISGGPAIVVGFSAEYVSPDGRRRDFRRTSLSIFDPRYATNDYGYFEIFDVPADAPVGSGVVVTDVRNNWPPWNPMTGAPAGKLSRPPTPLAHFEVAPADEPTVRGAKNAAARNDVLTNSWPEAWTSIWVGDERHSGKGRPSAALEPNEDGARLKIHLQRDADGPPWPATVAADIVVDDGRDQLETPTIVLPGGTHGGRYIDLLMKPGFDAKSVTVTLRPNPAAAEATLDVTEYLDESMSWSDVEVIPLVPLKDRPRSGSPGPAY